MSDPLKANTYWVHIFKELVQSKILASMSGAAAKLYIAIKFYVNWQTGKAFPSLSTLEEYAGLSRQSVVKGLKELEAMGLLRKEHKEGEKGSYQLVERFEVKDSQGRPESLVTFDYIPRAVNQALGELRHYTQTGDHSGNLQIIHIEKLQINIANNQQNLQQGTASQINKASEDSA